MKTAVFVLWSKKCAKRDEPTKNGKKKTVVFVDFFEMICYNKFSMLKMGECYPFSASKIFVKNNLHNRRTLL